MGTPVWLELLLMMAGSAAFFGMSFAMAGKGNRMWCLLLAPLVFVALAVACRAVVLLQQPGLLQGIGFLILLTLFPAINLCAAHAFKRCRTRIAARRKPSTTGGGAA